MSAIKPPVSASWQADRVLSAQAFLTDRDLCLLEWLYDHQVLTTDQITATLFPSRPTAQERLLRLHRLGLLERFRQHRAGQTQWHHVLDRLGVEIAAARRGDPPPRPAEMTAQRRRIATSPYLAHQVGVNQFFTDLIAHSRRHPGTALLRWWSEQQCAQPLRFGAVSMHRVRADGHGIYTDNDRRVAFFLEYDRGTESLPALVDKIQRYEHLITRGGPAWPVLFSLPNHAREHGLQQLLDRRPGTAPVATSTREALPEGHGPADAIWLPVRTRHPRQRLIDLDTLGDRADDATLQRLDRRCHK